VRQETLEAEAWEVVVRRLDLEVHLQVVVAADPEGVLRQEEVDRSPAATEDMVVAAAVHRVETDLIQTRKRKVPPGEIHTPVHRPVVPFSGA